MSNICDLHLRDLSLGLGVDSEDEVSAHVGVHGGWDNHILSRLQAMILSHIPRIGISLICLHRHVSPEEHIRQATRWCLQRIGSVFNVMTLPSEQPNVFFTQQ